MSSFHAVYKRFRRWKELGAFEKIWIHVVNEYSDQQLINDVNWFKTLFIDSTMIKNVGGCDELGKNPSDRGRLATKMSIICDVDEIPISCSFYPANKNDILTVEESVEKIACRIKWDGRIVNTIAGDKAYVSRTISQKLRNHNIRLISPPKKRSPRVLSNSDKTILKSRCKIEHVFCRLDKFRRIHCRHEKNLNSYAALNFLAMAIIVCKKLRD
jgi:putative transposase